MRVDTDAGEAWIKLPENPHGPHALVGEVVGTRLAEWLGLSTFEVCILEAPILSLPDGTKSQAGLAFAARKVVGQPWGGDDEQLARLANPHDLAGLVVVDTWTRNHDRYSARGGTIRRNLHNVFFGHEGVGDDQLKLLAMDFTQAVRCEAGAITRHSCAIDYERHTDVFGLFPEFRPYTTVDRVQHFLRRLAQFRREDAHAVVGSVPQAWHLSAEVRERVTDFLVGRAAYLTEHLEGLWVGEVARLVAAEAEAAAEAAQDVRAGEETGETGEA